MKGSSGEDQSGMVFSSWISIVTVFLLGIAAAQVLCLLEEHEPHLHLVLEEHLSYLMEHYMNGLEGLLEGEDTIFISWLFPHFFLFICKFFSFCIFFLFP